MTSPFTDEELRQLAKTRKNTDVPAQWISTLARELLQLRQQITPQAGAEPVKCQHCSGTGEIEPDNNGPIGPCPMCNGKGSYIPRAALPPPVCPHIRSSKDGTSWCDLAASVGDLSPSADDEVEDAGAEVDRQSMEYAAGVLKPWKKPGAGDL